MDEVRVFWQCYGSYTGKKDINLFSQYVYSQIHQEFVDYAFKMYVTESLRLQGEGKCLTRKFNDIVNPPKEVDAQKLIADFIEKSGIIVE